MDFELSEPQRMLQQSARDLIARHCDLQTVRRVMETDDKHDPLIWNEIVDQGWGAITAAEAHGGLGLGAVDLTVVCEEAGRACLPGPLHTCVWSAALLECCGAIALLESQLAGDTIISVAMLDEDTSWDVDAISTSATRTNDGVLLDGVKRFVPDPMIADRFILVARLDRDLALFDLPRNAPGLTIEPTEGIDATRAIGNLTMRDVSLPAAAVLATGDDARRALAEAIRLATVVTCADMIGGMQWLLETTVEYAKTRRQFGQPIGAFQAVQHQCADMMLLTESARSATYYAAWLLTADVPDEQKALAVSTAKAYCSDAAREVGNHAFQAHGGIGITWEHDLHLFYKRAKASEILFGDAAFHRERIARLIIDAHEI
ncbi:MAG: acyl-CoA dehydrogenase family protein [Planctomycetota bacterium]|jgi:alkylation response protein AidB-like acyl-CoA dehydrogenase